MTNTPTEKVGFTKEAIIDVMRFLLVNGFNQTTYEIAEAISILILKNLQTSNLIMGQAYAELAATGEKPDTFRARLGYNIKENYERVRKQISEKHGYDIGDYYGVKSFIEQMSIVYSVFTEKI